MSPREIWSNEAQERYVLAIAPADLPAFEAICERERCPVAVVGVATRRAPVEADRRSKNDGQQPVDMPMEVLLGKPPRMHRDVKRESAKFEPVDVTGMPLSEIAVDVLKHPTVASKSFLITIGDRSVGGTTARDQMVGPWQVPVADCAITTMDYAGFRGEAMTMAERTPLAVIDAPASGRMAVGEAVTNIAAAPIESLKKLKLSANWMAACGSAGEDAALFDTVKAIGMELCPALGISIPVGKDSLSMRTKWQDATGAAKEVVSPVSLIISAFAPVEDVRRQLTPQLRNDTNTVLIAIDLGRGSNRLGGSIFAQVTQQVGDTVPDVDDAEDLKRFFTAIQALNADGKLLAYHDRSDGGLWATVCEMAFAGHVGVSLNVDMLTLDPEPRIRLRRREGLGEADQRPPRGPHDSRAVLRRTRRGRAGAGGGSRCRAHRVARARFVGVLARDRQAERARHDRNLSRREEDLRCAARRIASRVERGELAHRASARQPGLRRCRIRRAARRGRSGHLAGA